MKNIRRLIALVMSLIMIFTLISCSTKPQKSEVAENGKLFKEPTDISIMMISHPISPYNENWIAWEYVREATNANIKINAVPVDFDVKVALAFASKDALPDLMVFDRKSLADQYAEQQAIIAIDDYEDIMPNYTAMWNSIDKDERDALLMYRKSSDGKTYFPQEYGSHELTNLKTWIYRKDILDENNLKAPVTTDDLYNLAVKLKKIYPDSYPICLRNFFENGVNTFGPTWKQYFTWGAYYDYNNKTWCYGSREDTMLEIIKYFNKLYNEKLIPPNFVTMTANNWRELVYNNRAFIFPQYFVQIDLLNKANRSVNPKFTVAPMTPPRANNGIGISKMCKYNIDPSGYVICNTGDKKRITNAIKFVDWGYSNEACELLSWGKEGETYNIVNGKKKFLLGENEDIRNKYGFQTSGLTECLYKEAVKAAYSDDACKNLDFVLKNVEDKYNPAEWLSFTSEELNAKKDIEASINTYAQQTISKFLIGQEPLSNWDSYVAELNKMGVDELMKIYETAFNSVK